MLKLWPLFRFLVNDLTYTTPRFCIFDSLFRNSPCKASKTIWTCCVWQHCSTWQRYWKRWNYYEHKEIRLHSLCHHFVESLSYDTILLCEFFSPFVWDWYTTLGSHITKRMNVQYFLAILLVTTLLKVRSSLYDAHRTWYELFWI